jgi:hypothetical protein
VLQIRYLPSLWPAIRGRLEAEAAVAWRVDHSLQRAVSELVVIAAIPRSWRGVFSSRNEVDYATAVSSGCRCRV